MRRSIFSAAGQYGAERQPLAPQRIKNSVYPYSLPTGGRVVSSNRDHLGGPAHDHGIKGTRLAGVDGHELVPPNASNDVLAPETQACR